MAGDLYGSGTTKESLQICVIIGVRFNSASYGFKLMSDVSAFPFPSIP